MLKSGTGTTDPYPPKGVLFDIGKYSRQPDMQRVFTVQVVSETSYPELTVGCYCIIDELIVPRPGNLVLVQDGDREVIVRYVNPGQCVRCEEAYVSVRSLVKGVVVRVESGDDSPIA